MLGDIKKFIMSVGPLYRTYSRLKGNRLHEPMAAGSRVSFVGSAYGGWGVDLSLLSPSSIVYAVGVGEDTSFDEGIIAAVGCEVHAFDPTPIAVRWMTGRGAIPGLRFHPIGLANEDKQVDFQVPPIEGWHSYSLTAEPGARQSGMVACEVQRLETIMAGLGHHRIDLLKMDIEGFEYQVIDDLLAGPVRPVQLLIEFHHRLYAHRADETRAAVAKLRRAGYEIMWMSDIGREYAFVRVDTLH